MSRKFISLIVASSIAITGLTAASQARAGDRDAAKFLLGATTLVIIGAALAHDRKHRSRHDHVTVVPHKRDPHRGIDRANPQRYGRVNPRPLPPRVSRKHLPARCVQTVRTGQGAVRTVRKHCLNNNYAHVATLPKTCREKLWTPNGTVRGFNPHCLRRNGYDWNRR